MLEGMTAAYPQVVNTIEAAHPDKPRPALPAKVTEMAKLRNDITVVPRQTGDALVHPLHWTSCVSETVCIISRHVRLVGVHVVLPAVP